MTHYDAIVIGGGHNGLVTAAYLAPGASSAAGVKKFLLAPAKHSFRLSTTELADTLIPLPGTGAAMSHRLPMMMLIPTGLTTNVFETIIELKRPDGTATQWSR